MTKFAITVRAITAEETYPLRNRVLRPGRPVEACRYDLDAVAIHLGAYVEGKNEAVGVITAHADAKQEFVALYGENQFRIRGMAVAPELQGKGVGKTLVIALLDVAKKRGLHFVWCNAREIAIPFYASLGFQISGGFFDIPGIGPHKVMYRPI